MSYIFDSSSLINLFKHYYPDRFPTLWTKFDDLANKARILSVREVSNEIKDYGDRLSGWAKLNHGFFHEPSVEELVFVADIFKIKNFQNLVRKREQYLGKPVADPFVIAKAKIIGGAVITEESKKDNSSRIPNVCEHFEVDCMNLEEFMAKENWTF